MIADLIEGIKKVQQLEGFDQFWPSLEKQLLNDDFAKGRRLYFRKDVSGGCKQMFIHCWYKF